MHRPCQEVPPLHGVWLRMARSAMLAGAGVLALLGSVRPAPAQTSLVPAQHPVYDWLYRQRVLGRIQGFPFESSPLSRGTIERFLESLSDAEASMGMADRSLLRAWLQEFSVEGLEAAAEDNFIRGPGPVHERILRIFGEDKEPHLYASADSTTRYAVDIFWSQGRIAGEVDDRGFATWLNEKGVRGFADFFGHVGFHLEAGNLSALSDKQGLSFDPLYGKSYQVVVADQNNSLYYEAMASGAWGPLSLHVGHGALHYGTGRDVSLILSRDAPPFDWIRLDADLGRIRYTALHGALSSRTLQGNLISGGDTLLVRDAPDRWLVLHRLDVLPVESLRIAFTEFLTYSHRGADYAYLNPVQPVFFSELDNEDRDNAFWALEGTWRPFSALELSALVMVDDMRGLFDAFKWDPGPGVDRALDFGATTALPWGTDVRARYTAIDPYVYSHKQRLNALEQRGFSLAHPLGPNADERSIEVRQWLPHRGSLTFELAHQRKGLNPVDAEGRLTQNVGGDLLEETGRKGQFSRFEGADLQKFRTLGLEGRIEPWRGILLRVRYERLSTLTGTRMPPRNFLDGRITIGF